MRVATVLPEPRITFGYGQELERPEHGLATFGPFDRDHESRPRSVRYGLIGTSTGLASARAFIDRLHAPIIPTGSLSHRLWPPFPGFQAAFACELPGAPA